mmetsp:Transcript_13857/g.23080  ORF Transcript_13857/g.23080 Transcript_13857/m.23080 type:complete len:99 (+) Transcript_13857:169-465(+)
MRRLSNFLKSEDKHSDYNEFGSMTNMRQGNPPTQQYLAAHFVDKASMKPVTIPEGSANMTVPETNVLESTHTAQLQIDLRQLSMENALLDEKIETLKR